MRMQCKFDWDLVVQPAGSDYQKWYAPSGPSGLGTPAHCLNA